MNRRIEIAFYSILAILNILMLLLILIPSGPDKWIPLVVIFLLDVMLIAIFMAIRNSMAGNVQR